MESVNTWLRQLLGRLFGRHPSAQAVEPGLVCQEFVELVTDYLEGRLQPELVARFEAHLALCDGCSRYLAQMRHTVAILAQLPPPSLSPDMKTELLSIFRQHQHE